MSVFAACRFGFVLMAARVVDAQRDGDWESGSLVMRGVIWTSGVIVSEMMQGSPVAWASMIVTGRPSKRDGKRRASIAMR